MTRGPKVELAVLSNHALPCHWPPWIFKNPGHQTVSVRALNPAVQIDHPKNNDSADCLPVPARCARRLSGRSAEKFFSRFENFRQQHADYGQTVTDHYFPGGLWTAGFRAPPETDRVFWISSSRCGAGLYKPYISLNNKPYILDFNWVCAPILNY